MKNLTHALKTSNNSYKALGLTHNSGLSQLLYKLHVYKMYITTSSKKIPFIIYYNHQQHTWKPAFIKSVVKTCFKQDIVSSWGFSFLKKKKMQHFVNLSVTLEQGPI